MRLCGRIQATPTLYLVACSAQAATAVQLLVSVLPVLAGAGRHVFSCTIGAARHVFSCTMLLLRPLHLPHVL